MLLPSFVKNKVPESEWFDVFDSLKLFELVELLSGCCLKVIMYTITLNLFIWLP